MSRAEVLTIPRRGGVIDARKLILLIRAQQARDVTPAPKRTESVFNIDFAAVEARIMAQMGLKPKDAHAETAKEMFGTDNPTKEQRSAAKRANFLRFYGGTAR